MEVLYQLRGLTSADQAAEIARVKITRIKTLHSLNVKLGQVTSNLNLCRAELKKPRVVNLSRIAAAVKSAEDAAVLAGELSILKAG